MDKTPGWNMVEEFQGASLGDARRSQRLLKLVAAFAADPQAGIPKAAKGDAALEGAYRFVNNRGISIEGIIAPHYEKTIERAQRYREVYAIHDGTEFNFPGQARRKGLGVTSSGSQGFLSHVSLLAAPDGTREPLGLIGWRNSTKPFGKKKKSKREIKNTPRKQRKSAKWHEAALEVAQRLEGGPSVIHVMDREADGFLLYWMLSQNDQRFIVRVASNRRLGEKDGVPLYLFDRLDQGKELLRREVPLSRRRKTGKRQRHPPRGARVAELAISAQSVDLPRPVDRFPDAPARSKVSLNLVRVHEPNPPKDQEPVEWKLFTTEPIDTPEDVARIVDGYRLRWLIEEFFKALKTGCAYESRQLESLHALTNLLGILAPIACNLLLLRALDRAGPNAAAEPAITPRQVEVLRAFSPDLPRKPTAAQALLAIASLGGHIKNNGAPGWLVLLRGMKTLVAYEAGWAAHERAITSGARPRRSKSSDQ